MWSLLSTEITLKRYSNTHIKGVCNNYNSVTKLIVTTASSYKCCFFKILFIFIYFLIIIIIIFYFTILYWFAIHRCFLSLYTFKNNLNGHLFGMSFEVVLPWKRVCNSRDMFCL